MASEYIAPIEVLIEQFRSLKGIGRKTAARLAFCILDFSDEQAEHFANSIIEAKRACMTCEKCFNISEAPVCSLCSDPERDGTTVCVVEDPRAVIAFEKVREYRGLYHVLGGVISPMDGIGPEQLHIRELLDRVKNDGVKEVILATNPTIEGETTAMYLAGLLKPLGIKVSRLAYGVPVGGDLEYADEVTLLRAIEGRKDID